MTRFARLIDVFCANRIYFDILIMTLVTLLLLSIGFFSASIG